MGLVVLILFLSSCLLVGPGLYAALDAWMKGYRPWFWLVSLGPVGLLLMLLRPNLNQAKTPEERERWEQRANWTGGILSGVTLFCAIMPVPAVLVLYSVRSTAVPRAAAVIVAPPPVSAPDLEVEPAVDSQVLTAEPSQSETIRTEGSAP
jgi:hypothetical protein